MNSFKIHIRNLFRKGNFSLLNIFGFTVGITLSLLIFLFVRYEVGYDSHVADRENIYRIVEYQIQDGTTLARCPMPLSYTLKQEFPEIDLCVGLFEMNSDIELKNNMLKDVSSAIADAGIIDMFNFKMLAGNASVLSQPNTAIVTKNFAEKNFGNLDVQGKILKIRGLECEIKGVIDNVPPNSLVDYDILISEKTRYALYPEWNERWWNGGLSTFVTFKGEKIPPGIQSKINSIQKKYYPEYLLNRHEYKIIPFKGSHFNTSLLYDIKDAVSPRLLFLLSLVGLSVLLVASLNFINISFASQVKRINYIGIRKINGARRYMLIRDYLVDTTIIIGICVFLSFIFINLLLPYFNQLVARKITFESHTFNSMLLFLFTVGITVSLVGTSPAIYFSDIKPLSAVKGRVKSNNLKVRFHTFSVISQFSIALVLIICLLFFNKQVSYMKNYFLGFDKDNLMVLPVAPMGRNLIEMEKNAELFKEGLNKYSQSGLVSKMSITEFVPGFSYWNNFKIFPEGNLYTDGIELTSSSVDENYLEVYKRKMIYGRFFNLDFASDKDAIIINKAAMERFGWVDLDNKFICLHSKLQKSPVIGVINDINIQSLQHGIDPMIYRFKGHNNYPQKAAIRISPGYQAEAIKLVEQEFSKLFPGIAFEYNWVNEQFKSAYGEEEKLIKIIGVFSFFTLLLSILGVYALSVIVAANRTKEIGIRKVNGAKVFQIMKIMNKNFVEGIFFALVIAIPISLIIVRKWLESFAYKTALSWWIFLLAGLLALIVAVFAVTIQTWRAARKNPVEALRYE